MEFNLDKRKLILALKKVKKERNLNIDQITEIVIECDKNIAPSRSSIARVFAEHSEDDASHFKFETTLKPISDALLDVETDEQDDTADSLAYKSLLRYKKDLLADYDRQNRELKEEIKALKDKERKRYNDKLAKETEQFHKSINFAKEQIRLKDHRIDILLDANDRLMQTNNRLLEQLMDCPYRKEGRNET